MYLAEQIFELLRTKTSDFWIEEGKKRSLALFHEAAKRVPAYKDFLKQHGVDSKKIKTWEDFQKVPLIDKKNYLKKYPLEKLCWDGALNHPMVFTSTSGSTGDPIYFCRGEKLDWQSSLIHELFLKNTAHGIKKPTLVIVGFGMGVWIGGLITYKAFEIAAQRGNYPVSIITTGINKKEIFRALKILAPKYHQTIIVGYPPFIKDIIDESEGEGVDIKKLRVRFLFAAEAFTEKFRNHIAEKAGVKNVFTDTLSVYGSADIGTMAYETTISILIKRLALKNKSIFKDLFSHATKVPTLAQFNPLHINFEALEDGEVVLTGDSAIPLVRYAIGDHGGVFSFNEMEKLTKKYGVDIRKEEKKVGIKETHQLPFVYVYERNDNATTIYGLLIYPEIIREALLDKMLAKSLTGKFNMETKFDKKQDQFLEINLELRKGEKTTGALKKNTEKMIFNELRAKSSEFKELSDFLGKRARPKLVFWPAEHPTYFKPGVKQKWTKK